MEVKEMDLEQVEQREQEIENLLTEEVSNEVDLDALEGEIVELKERKAQILTEIETRKQEEQEVVNTATEVETFEEEVLRKDERKMELKEIRESRSYVEAFANYIKTDDDAQVRALLTENAEENGTLPVPVLVDEVVRTAWEREGITALVNKAYVKGNLKVGFEISGDDAIVHKEGKGAITPENLTHGVVTLIPQSIKKLVQISDEALDMESEAFLRYIYDEVTYRIAKKLADTLVQKLVDAPATSAEDKVGVPAVQATTIEMGTIAEAMASLSDEASNPVIIMNKLTWGAFKKAQYDGNYPVDIFEGLRVVFNNTLPAFKDAESGKAYAIVGDLGYGALANFPRGEEIKFKFDDTHDMASDLVNIFGRMYVAIEPVAPNAFVKITK